MRGDKDDDNDFLDAGCEPGLEFKNTVAEEHTPFLVLFANMDRDDRDAVEHRAQEWRELFGGDKSGV